MAENVKASLLGCALGDAYGGAFARSEMPMNGGQWTLSADTQQLLATCRSVCDEGRISPEAIAREILAWHKKGQLVAPGPATLMALIEMSTGKTWQEIGQRGNSSLTHESVTRIAPLAFLVDPGTEAGQEAIRRLSRITHQSEQAWEAGFAIVLALKLIRNESQNLMQHVIRQLHEGALRDRLIAISKKPGLTLRELGRQFGASANVIDSIPLVIFASLRAPQLNFEGLMKEVVSAGGEMRGNCAIAGLIAGHYYGMEALPKDWLEKLRDNRHWQTYLDIAADFAAFAEKAQGIQKLF